ncbi:hypothetical protein ABZ635_19185 [Nocardiopsis sp. NPDC007018]|uniref:hypothetical protein n=1 Tax=Nocardiopsis sp. NPDC007018 TaxID=3155721 RepID=UPI003407BDF7
MSPEEEAVLERLRKNAVAAAPDSARNFLGIGDDIVLLWTDNRRHQRSWHPRFQEEAAELLRKSGNRHGFTYYFFHCEDYSLRISGDGFWNACYYRSKVQILIENLVPFADLVHPADTDGLEEVDELFVSKADDIVPIPPEEIPGWIPESHWWWRVPTRHDWTETEINERLYGYYEEDYL